jgi:Mor family transcriptional regulator
MRPRSYRPEYVPPGRDSPRAIAQAQMFLSSARSIDGATVESLARQYRLSEKRAEYLLTIETQRRAR